MLSPRLRTASCATQRRCGLIRSKRPLGRVSSAVTVAEGIGPDPFSFATVPVPEASTWHSSALDQIDLDKARQGLAVLEQYSSQAVNAAGAAVGRALSPFQLFGGSWFLNFMFFGILGLLTYSLLVLAPRQ